MLASTFSFALMTVCAREAGTRCGDWRITAVARALIVFLFAAALAKGMGVKLIWTGNRILWMRSIAGSVSMLMTFYAMTRHDNVSTAITLTNTYPLWVTILAWPVLRQRPTLGATIALVSGIAGVILIERPDRGDFRWASAAALAAAVCSAVVMLGLNRLRHLDPIAIVVHFSAVATVFCGGFSLVTMVGGRQVDFSRLSDPVVIAVLLGIGLFGMAGQVLMTASYRYAMPQRLSVIGLTQIVFVLILEHLIWGERFTLEMIVGIALIVGPVSWLLMHGRRTTSTEPASG